ncbi:PAS domain-containing protein [Sorangium sp. So ce367]|uniref:PAS domain-containing protein n=1 Tax=Sorangium sp. So ce367 TaxID=3133305 RepID=UPI003F61EB37
MLDGICKCPACNNAWIRPERDGHSRAERADPMSLGGMDIEGLQAELERLRCEVKALEQRAQAAEAQAALYQGVFEHLPVPSALYGADGVLVDINRRNREILAVPSKEAMVGKHNMYEDPVALAGGYTAHFDQVIRSGGGVIMAPTAYNTADAGLDRTEDRTVWTETRMSAADVGGARYVIGINLDVTDRMRAQQAYQDSAAFVTAIVEHAPSAVYVKDLNGRYALVNRHFERLMGLSRDAVLGRADRDVMPSELAEAFAQSERQVIATEAPLVKEEQLLIEGRVHSFVTTRFPLLDSRGTLHAVCGISVEVTESRAAEAEAQRLQDEIIHLQEARLRALSTPLLPIARGVVVMPLIGNIDAPRAQQVLEILLEGIVAHQASMVILDVTGVPTIDTQVASALVRTARAVNLLGAQVLLTGIQPAIARTLVELGADLGGLLVRSTLDSGIAYALTPRPGRRAGTLPPRP